ncbi:hypothetical protein QOT17_017259 [Balamuthia mandrillaris]
MGRQHVAAAFLLGTLYVYTVVGVCIIPMWGTRSPGSITAFCLVGVYVLWFLSCYLRAVFTKPGHPSPKWKHRPHVFVSNISQRKKKAQKEAQGSSATNLTDEPPPSALPPATISKAEPAAPAQMVTGFMQKDGPNTYSESELEACEAQPLLHNQYEHVANAETTEPVEVREPPDCERVEAETEWPYCSICRSSPTLKALTSMLYLPQTMQSVYIKNGPPLDSIITNSFSKLFVLAFLAVLQPYVSLLPALGSYHLNIIVVRDKTKIVTLIKV